MNSVDEIIDSLMEYLRQTGDDPFCAMVDIKNEVMARVAIDDQRYQQLVLDDVSDDVTEPLFITLADK